MDAREGASFTYAPTHGKGTTRKAISVRTCRRCRAPDRVSVATAPVRRAADLQCCGTRGERFDRPCCRSCQRQDRDFTGKARLSPDIESTLGTGYLRRTTRRTSLYVRFLH